MNTANFEALKEIQREMYASQSDMYRLGEALTAQLFPGLQNALRIPGGFLRKDEKRKEIVEFWFQFYYCGTWDEPLSEAAPLLPVRSLLKDIRSQNLPIESFYLTVSTYFKNGALKKWLEDNIREYLGPNVNEVYVFDLKDFFNFLFEQVDGDLRDNILSANQRFFEEYRERMEQHFYLTDVPFSDGKNHERLNPMFFLDEVLKVQFAEMSEFLYVLKRQGRQAATQPTRQKCFLVSEFGFGKTSLLLNYARRLKDLNIIPVYIPMALVDKMTFRTVSDFSRNILAIITGQQLDEQNDHYDRFRIRAFKEMLKIRTDIVLLFDGLDEHPQAYKPEGLQQIAYCLKDFKPPCVFSVRKEFWDARRERFEEAFISKKRPFEKIELLEWTDDIILNYLNQFGRKTQTKGRLTKFVDLVKNHGYEQQYGDIPKRPLFLEMLVRDVLSGEITRRNLSELYESYFREKFRLGRETFYEERTGRPLPVQDAGAEVIVEKMLLVMERTAAEMLSNDEEGNIEFLSQIAVQKIERFLQDAGIHDDLAFFLHSVLITFDKHSVSGLKVKFAHKSFQEYFVARYLARLLFSPGSGSSIDYDWLTRYKITEGVPKFMAGIIETLDEQDQATCQKTLKNLCSDSAVEKSVVKRLAP